MMNNESFKADNSNNTISWRAKILENNNGQRRISGKAF